jgi:hypothetical protein
MKALIGLLYLVEALWSNMLSLEELRSTDTDGVEKFWLVMKQMLQFPNQIQIIQRPNNQGWDKKERKKKEKKNQNNNNNNNNNNKKARLPFPYKWLIAALVENCNKKYSLGENVNTEEKFEAFRGWCGFKQYIPSKSDKYWIKI